MKRYTKMMEQKEFNVHSFHGFLYGQEQADDKNVNNELRQIHETEVCVVDFLQVTVQQQPEPQNHEHLQQVSGCNMESSHNTRVRKTERTI